jgi:hypothetical protein
VLGVEILDLAARVDARRTSLRASVHRRRHGVDDGVSAAVAALGLEETPHHGRSPRAPAQPGPGWSSGSPPVRLAKQCRLSSSASAAASVFGAGFGRSRRVHDPRAISTRRRAAAWVAAESRSGSAGALAEAEETVGADVGTFAWIDEDLYGIGANRSI